MIESVPTQEGVVKLPNLAPRIITVVLIVCLVLLIGQGIQDRSEQREVVEFEKISLYYQQLDFTGQINNATMALSTNDNESAVNDAQSLLRTSVKQLRWTQDELLTLEQRKQELGVSAVAPENEAVIDKKLDQIILYANETLAEVEAKNSDGQHLAKLSDILALSYQSFQSDTSHYIVQLTSQLHDDNQESRRVDWLLTLFTILLVLLVSLGIYWRGKQLVHRQFNQLKALKNKLELQSFRDKESAQRIINESERGLAQRMKLSSILDSTVDGIITINADGMIDSFNKAAETMFGYPADFVIGKNVKMLMPEPYSSEHDGYLANYHSTGEQKIIGKGREIIGRRIDGSEFTGFLSVSKVEGTKYKLFTGIIQDITAWKKTDTKLQSALTELTQKQAELEEEERIAQHVFENITASNNDTIPEVSSWCEPMGTFSGDMMLSAILPSGGVRILLCDFTGHGLPAALGAVPVSTIHSAMAKKGLPLEILMEELNDKLNALLPTGIFCCIAGVDLDASRTYARVWNAGLPEVLVVNQSGEITQRIASNHLPLGVVAYDKDEMHCQDIRLGNGDSIYALSDGLTEAENEAGEMFGQTRFEQLLVNETGEQGRLFEIRNSITGFVGKAPATDDISLIEIKTLSTVG